MWFFTAELVNLAPVIWSLSLESQHESPLYVSFINLVWGKGVKGGNLIGSHQQGMNPSEAHGRET